MLRSMWFPKGDAGGQWDEAIVFLSDRSPVMKRIITHVGPCTLARKRDAYVSLVQSILSQQVSMAAAASMYNKLKASLPDKRVTPGRVTDFLRDADEQQLRDCGLSRQKRRYVKELTERFVDGRVPLKQFRKMSDQQIIESLTDCVGVGLWTAQMFLMFTLNRPDVWPVGDLGLRQNVVNHLGVKDREDWEAVETIGLPFSPWRTVACWYLWRSSEK